MQRMLFGLRTWTCTPNSGNPVTSEKYRTDFPRVTIVDMVRSQKILIDSLGIPKLHAVMGSSMGAMLSLAWLALYPARGAHARLWKCDHGPQSS